jgi:hypothetical protein
MTESANPETTTKSSALDPFWFVLGAYLFTFIWFFIRSVFFNPNQVMMVFETVRRLDPIGYDLMMMLSHASAWLNHTISPYASFNNFPPLATLLFTPLTIVPIQRAYAIITLITLGSFFWVGFLFPYFSQKPRVVKPLLVLVFITALTSYGLQFEIERGQFYSIAFALAFAGIYLFHRHPKLSWLAYILFTLAIQIKLFPVILIFLFIRDWRDWRANLIRILGLGAANFALFFVLGWTRFLEFVTILRTMVDDSGIWVGNLSVKSFAYYQMPILFKRINLGDQNAAGTVEFVVMALVLILLMLGIFQAYRRNRQGIDPYLLLVCTCAAMVIPQISHDYKLPALAGPVAILLMTLKLSKEDSKARIILMSVGIAVFSLAYFSTQYSYVMKSPLIANNFLAVFLMMVLGVIFAFTEQADRNDPAG